MRRTIDGRCNRKRVPMPRSWVDRMGQPSRFMSPKRSRALQNPSAAGSRLLKRSLLCDAETVAGHHRDDARSELSDEDPRGRRCSHASAFLVHQEREHRRQARRQRRGARLGSAWECPVLRGALGSRSIPPAVDKLGVGSHIEPRSPGFLFDSPWFLGFLSSNHSSLCGASRLWSDAPRFLFTYGLHNCTTSGVFNKTCPKRPPRVPPKRVCQVRAASRGGVSVRSLAPPLHI